MERRHPLQQQDYESILTMTDNFDDIFRSQGVMHGKMLLLPPLTALEYIRVCREKGVVILGFDAFRLLSGDRIQPIMEDSLDLSATPFSRLSPFEGIEIAERFINERLGKNILFEMVIG
jgi:hypothetical protein